MQAISLSAPEVVAFYRQIVDDGDVRMLPMLSLVQRIVCKEYAVRFRASTSHHTLCINGELDFGITVAFLPTTQRFEIRYWEKADRHCQKYQVTAPDAEALIDALALRLFIQGRNADKMPD